MELWLTYVDRSGGRRDCAVDTDGAHTVRDLARALELPARAGIHLVRTGEKLSMTATLEDVGIRVGDVLEIQAPAQRPTGAPWSLHIVGGPGASRTVPLVGGEHIVGRGADVDIPIRDSALSRRHLRLTVTDESVTVGSPGTELEFAL